MPACLRHRVEHRPDDLGRHPLEEKVTYAVDEDEHESWFQPLLRFNQVPPGGFASRSTLHTDVRALLETAQRKSRRSSERSPAFSSCHRHVELTSPRSFDLRPVAHTWPDFTWVYKRTVYQIWGNRPSVAQENLRRSQTPEPIALAAKKPLTPSE